MLGSVIGFVVSLPYVFLGICGGVVSILLPTLAITWISAFFMIAIPSCNKLFFLIPISFIVIVLCPYNRESCNVNLYYRFLVRVIGILAGGLIADGIAFFLIPHTSLTASARQLSSSMQTVGQLFKRLIEMISNTHIANNNEDSYGSGVDIAGELTDVQIAIDFMIARKGLNESLTLLSQSGGPILAMAARLFSKSGHENHRHHQQLFAELNGAVRECLDQCSHLLLIIRSIQGHEEMYYGGDMDGHRKQSIILPQTLVIMNKLATKIERVSDIQAHSNFLLHITRMPTGHVWFSKDSEEEYASNNRNEELIVEDLEDLRIELADSIRHWGECNMESHLSSNNFDNRSNNKYNNICMTLALIGAVSKVTFAFEEFEKVFAKITCAFPHHHA